MVTALSSGFGDLVAVTGCGIQVIQGLQDAAVDIVLQLGAAQGLERVWRDAGGDAGFQDDAVLGAAAARNRVLDDLDVRVRSLQGREHGIRGFALTGSSPPVEDFQLLLHRLRRSARPPRSQLTVCGAPANFDHLGRRSSPPRRS